jgi:L-aspartate oxidase
MTHVVVVGSGIAGITAALHAETAGAAVTLVSKGALDDANTTFAQGGIAAVSSSGLLPGDSVGGLLPGDSVGGPFPGDSVDDHVRDTLAAGAWLGDPAAVRVLAAEAAARIGDLIAAGVVFDRDDSGDLARGLEAAHSFPRILHAGGDATGRAIEQALVARLRASTVRILEGAFLVDLVLAAGRVTGVDLLIAGSRGILAADAVVLATGGAGALYAHTTNPAVATGDGIAAALRAGAAVADLEFVQFHPTVLAAGTPFLVSEAVRGEGATVVDETGRRFLFDAHPDGELAPRDVVARAIAHRMREQDGRPVLLDATAVRGGDTAEFLAARFPTIDAAVRARGLDWARAPIPVTPAAHYLMGGVVTDLDGRTTVPGLYAAGECARTGVHGANRLASNSLLEGAVFGTRAGAAAADGAAAGWPAADASVALSAGPASPTDSETSAAIEAPPFSRIALQQLMWDCAGVERDAMRLGRATRTLATWAAAERPAARAVAEHEDENLLQLARAVVAAASARRTSVGAHTRLDGPAGTTASSHSGGTMSPADPVLLGAAERSSARVLTETR